MKKYQNFSKEEARLLLMSQGLSANLWKIVSDNLKKDVIHFPDPAFIDSQSWPDYMSKQSPVVLDFNQISDPERGSMHLTGTDIFKSQSDDLNVNSPQQNSENKSYLSNEPADVTEENHSDSNLKPHSVKKNKNRTELISGKKTRSKKIQNVKPAVLQELEFSHEKKSGKIKTLDFFSWLDKLGSSDRANSNKKVTKIHKVSVKKRQKEVPKAQQLADNSLILNDEVVSETLARLLVRQGHNDKAIQMYEKLILKYPEKVATFAAALQKLKS